MHHTQRIRNQHTVISCRSQLLLTLTTRFDVGRPFAGRSGDDHAPLPGGFRGCQLLRFRTPTRRRSARYDARAPAPGRCVSVVAPGGFSTGHKLSSGEFGLGVFTPYTCIYPDKQGIRHENIETLAILIHRSPEVAGRASDAD